MLTLTTAKYIIAYTIAGLVVALWFRTDSKARKPLPSLRVNPSDSYIADFYPNGNYLELPMGTMRYWLFGNPSGKRVVMIHGISTGSPSYDKLARYMADAGHHVLVFDLWGRGYSDAPATYYDEGLYTSQLALLLQKVGWHSDVDVVGVSLGGAIATSFTAFYPEVVNRLILIAPAGLMQADSDVPLYGKIFRLPVISKLVLNPILKPVATWGITQFYNTARPVGKKKNEDSTRIAEAAFSQFQKHSGFFTAFLSTVMDYPLFDLHNRYKTVGQRDTNRKVLLIWGTADRTVPFRHAKLLTSLIPQTKLSVYDDEAHDVLMSRHPEVNAEIKEFLA
ncbi:Alpha/Beta hydrolase protein [Zychaea mexicana]|uniref:Alpha/Beta hydrolase protein n=1 Tax=Zychaea mexicana TaxID=64656 RepID=UPI0022FDC056|nr:Alpha/Beta hydrolase protein [Zychaea mexicana]KAI9494894.1 Alpha/Beta hydrolase protein [Zychaea mexicana]